MMINLKQNLAKKTYPLLDKILNEKNGKKSATAFRITREIIHDSKQRDN